MQLLLLPQYSTVQYYCCITVVVEADNNNSDSCNVKRNIHSLTAAAAVAAIEDNIYI